VTDLAALIASCSDAVLTAASSKGVLIRARKDVEAGKVALQSRTPLQAELSVDGETVLLSAKALAASRCSCPATGICRHIVAAALQLRGGSDDAPPPAPADHPVEDLPTYAGSDWPAAVTLARTASVVDGETVAFPATGDQVTLPVGRPLRDALYKGPHTSRRRLAVVAAALVLAARDGHQIPTLITPEAPAQISADLLDQVQKALEGAVLALAAGNLGQSRDRLFAAAIAARVETIPRLAAALRSLSERLDPDTLRSADFGPSDALAEMARAYALAEALKSYPGDTELTGVVSRGFTPAGQRQMVMVGADVWRSPSGARGMTAILVDPESGRFHKATEARGAGTDLTFDPMTALRSPIWSARPPLDLMGHGISFADVLLSDDGGVSLSQIATATARVGFDQLNRAGVVLHDWGDLAARIVRDLGRGLRRRFGETHVILAPRKTDSPQLDPFDQTMVWRWYDKAGRTFDLTLPDMPDGLGGQEDHVLAGLVALDRPDQGRLLSVWISGDQGPVPLPFGKLPKVVGWQRLLDQGRKRLKPRPRVSGVHTDRLSAVLTRTTETVLAQLGRADAAWPNDLLSEIEALGLSRIASLMRSFSTNAGPAGALQLTFAIMMLSEIAGPQAKR